MWITKPYQIEGVISSFIQIVSSRQFREMFISLMIGQGCQRSLGVSCWRLGSCDWLLVDFVASWVAADSATPAGWSVASSVVSQVSNLTVYYRSSVWVRMLACFGFCPRNCPNSARTFGQFGVHLFALQIVNH